MLHRIDQLVDFSGTRAELAPYCSKADRALICPYQMTRMLVAGYCFGIRSERRFCDEVHLNLAYRWFCRLGLEGTVPDHSTFSKNRHGRFREGDICCKLFDLVFRLCLSAALVGGETFVLDPIADHYTCPAGALLRQFNRIFKSQRSGVTEVGQRLCRARKTDCVVCPLKDRYCPGQPHLEISRSIHEALRDVARDIAKTDAYIQFRRKRKKVKTLFAHPKRILGMTRLRLRSPNSTHDEFHLAAKAQNLRNLATLVPVLA